MAHVEEEENIYTYNCPPSIAIERALAKKGYRIILGTEKQYSNDPLPAGIKIFFVTISDYHERLTDSLQIATADKLKNSSDTIIVLCPGENATQAQKRWRDIDTRVNNYAYEVNNEKALFYRKHSEKRLFVATNRCFESDIRYLIYEENPNCISVLVRNTAHNISLS